MADERVVWGVRCTQNIDDTLWLGSIGDVFKEDRIPFEKAFPNINNKKVLETLKKVRGSRTGAFWLNPKEKVLTIITDNTIEDEEYPQIRV